MTILALRGIQLPLQIGHRPGLDRRRPPPSDGGDKLSPGIKQIGVDAQLPPNNLSRLTAAKPVQDRLTFEGFVEFPVLSDSCLFHGSSRSLSTQFSVRQFEATSNLLTTDCSLRLVFTHETRVRFPSPAPFIINNLQS